MSDARGTLPDNLDIGFAAPDDLPALVRLLADDMIGSIRESLMPADLPDYQKAFDYILSAEHTKLFVARIDGAVVGMGQATFMHCLSLRGTLRCDIEAMRVSSKWRGRRIGEALLEAITVYAKSKGAGVLSCMSNKVRMDSHRFYESHGFMNSHEGFRKRI